MARHRSGLPLGRQPTTLAETSAGDLVVAGGVVGRPVVLRYVDHAVHVVAILEDEGQADDVGLRDHLAHGAEVEGGDVDGAEAYLLDGVELVATPAGVVGLAGQPAVRFLGGGGVIGMMTQALISLHAL